MQVNATDQEWREWLEKLALFRQTFGHCRVPPKWPGNPGLSQWVQQQRGQFDTLSLERLEELYRFGFDFGPNRYWLARFFELLEFKRAHGDCNVPARWPDNPQLGGWLSGQRARKSTMPIGRRQLLDRIGMDWAPLEQAWNRRYEELVAYKEQHGHCNVPGEWEENRQLGLWVSNQRQRKHRLKPVQKRLLNRLGFDWSPADTVWKAHLKELREFRKEHGHSNVPPKYAKNPALGSWVAELRKRGQSGVPQRWRRQLRALQFDWSPARTQWWEARFCELRAFKTEFGHCEVPKNWPPNPELGDWVSTQRTCEDKLSTSRRRRLERLGFTWRLITMSPAKPWDGRFEELVEFKKRFGHCDVPGTWPENQPLAEWVTRQRSRDKAKLTPEQRRRLEELGFCWGLRAENWDQRFSQLQAFWAEHGHCDVPRRWPENPGLHGWVLRQRYRKDTLSAERIQKLDRLNFRWLGAERGKRRSKLTGRFVLSSSDL